MQENSYPQNEDDINQLLYLYEGLLTGKTDSFLDVEAYEQIIDYFDDQENLPKALEAAETGLEYFPFSSQLLIKKADLFIAFRKYEEALQILQKAELYDTSDLNLYILKTDVFLALDRQNEAVILLEEALEIFKGDQRIELLFELADVYDDYEAFDKVFDCLKIILEEEPANEEALYKICFWTEFTGRFEESIQLHKNIIDKHPYTELAWFNLATAYQCLRLYEKAIDAYQYALVINEKFAIAYRNLGDAYMRLRKFKEAIEAFRKTLELTRPDSIIYEAIGHCFKRIGNFAQARFHYRKASHMSPADSKLYYKIALTYIDEKQWQSAIKHLESALDIQRNVTEYNIAMGECKMQLENYKEAVQYLSIAVRQKPKNISGWEVLIRCLYKAACFEEACRQCVSALKATDQKPIFLFFYSACLFSCKKQKEALAQLEEAMERSPRLVKKFIEFNASILQNHKVVDLIAHYKKRKKI